MKLLKAKLLYLLWGGAVFFAGLVLWGLVQSLYLPGFLHLSPGQKISLTVHYPLSFYTPVGNGKNLISAQIPRNQSFNTKNLILNPQTRGHIDVQLRIFGSIPIKKLQVEIAEPPLVIPGGQAIGVLLSSRGVVIVGHLPLKGINHQQYYPARDAGIKVGDILMAIDNIPVNRADEVERILKNLKPPGKILQLSVKRYGKIRSITIKPVLCSGNEKNLPGRYMLGIFIEDPAAGVGTLTFYDPATRRFAGLGHRIAEFAGNKGISFQNGEIVLANISGIRMGNPGQPGEKIGIFNVNFYPMGKIDLNCRFGIYGTLLRNFPDHPLSKPIPAAYVSQVKVGPAEIYTVVRGDKVERFQVEIIRVFHQDQPRDKGLIIRVTDPALLKQTGGIIQGMSGSPIIQEGRLVGAVTHVFVNDPTKGYGVLAEWMIKEINSEYLKMGETS